MAAAGGEMGEVDVAEVKRLLNKAFSQKGFFTELGNFGPRSIEITEDESLTIEYDADSGGINIEVFGENFQYAGMEDNWENLRVNILASKVEISRLMSTGWFSWDSTPEKFHALVHYFKEHTQTSQHALGGKARKQLVALAPGIALAAHRNPKTGALVGFSTPGSTTIILPNDAARVAHDMVVAKHGSFKPAFPLTQKRR